YLSCTGSAGVLRSQQQIRSASFYRGPRPRPLDAVMAGVLWNWRRSRSWITLDGGAAVPGHQWLGPSSLLHNPPQFDILQSGPGRGPNAIRSIETARVHHAARRCGGGMAVYGPCAAADDASDRISWPRITYRVR